MATVHRSSEGELVVRVLVLSWRDIHNPSAGGAERFTFEHMRRWAATGHDVTLFTASYPGAPAESQLAGIRVVRRGSENTVHLAAQQWFRRQTPAPDVIVDEIHGIPFCSAPWAYPGVPVVALLHEVLRDVWFSMRSLPVAVAGYLIEAATLRAYARRNIPFLTVSASTAADLSALGVPPASITVVANGIGCPPVHELPGKDADPTLVAVGRIVRSKRLEDAIHALRLVRGNFPRARLWIIGAGTPEYVAELHQLTARLGLSDAVAFLGRVSEEEKFRRLARAHVLVHPSQREGWGINVIEANAMGTPAVGYRVPGLRDSVVHDETGLLCAYRQPAALAALIGTLLSSPERYRRMQQAALRWSKRFSWDVAAEQSLRLLHAHGRPQGTVGACNGTSHLDRLSALPPLAVKAPELADRASDRGRGAPQRQLVTATDGAHLLAPTAGDGYGVP